MFCFSTISFSIKVKEKTNFTKPDVIINFYFYWQEACLPTIAQVKLASNVVKFLPTRYNQESLIGKRERASMVFMFFSSQIGTVYEQWGAQKFTEGHGQPYKVVQDF